LDGLSIACTDAYKGYKSITVGLQEQTTNSKWISHSIIIELINKKLKTEAQHYYTKKTSQDELHFIPCKGVEVSEDRPELAHLLQTSSQLVVLSLAAFTGS